MSSPEQTRPSTSGTSLKLFTIAGLEVRVHFSWLVLMALIVWSLAKGYFPARNPGLTPPTYWWMAIAGAVGLFFSIVLHELAHSLVAIRHRIPMKGITLFMLGGVAEMSDEPPSARAEFQMAAAGPAASFLLSLVFLALSVVSESVGAATTLSGALFYLAGINALLAVFNLIPAFPLDGGRILRSILWYLRGDLLSATRWAAAAGYGFSLLLMVVGVYNLVRGNGIAGLWWMIMGMFLNGAAGSGMRQVAIRSALKGEAIEKFMRADPVSVSPALSIREFVDDFVYKYHFKMFPVVRDERLIGCISTADVRKLHREQWETTSVGAIAHPCEENSVSPETDAMEVVSRMNQTGKSRMLVREGDRLVGIVSLKDMLAFLALKLELEGAELKPPDVRKAA